MIPKPGKNLSDLASYRPISLLPVLSKLLEKLLLKRLQPILEERELIPSHQFGFRNQHSTIEQVHRIVKEISNNLESKRYCSAVFLDVKQAFDKVWQVGLCHKLKKVLPHHFYEILSSYLKDRWFLVKQRDELSDLHTIASGVPQGSVLGPVLYTLFTADIPTTNLTTVATFADDTAILASDTNPTDASAKLQNNLHMVEKWLRKWRLQVNNLKSVHVTFTMKRGTCPLVTLNNTPIPQAEDVKYLGIHLDRRLTWRKHIFTKRKQLGLKFSQLYWLTGRKSQLKIENKLLLYKTIVKPIWSYGIQLWGTASISNIEILQRFQNKVLRSIVDAPWYVPNHIIQSDLKIKTVREEIKSFYEKYQARLIVHPNNLATQLLENNDEIRRLKRFKPSDLSTRFD